MNVVDLSKQEAVTPVDHLEKNDHMVRQFDSYLLKKFYGFLNALNSLTQNHLKFRVPKVLQKY